MPFRFVFLVDPTTLKIPRCLCIKRGTGLRPSELDNALRILLLHIPLQFELRDVNAMLEGLLQTGVVMLKPWTYRIAKHNDLESMVRLLEASNFERLAEDSLEKTLKFRQMLQINWG